MVNIDAEIERNEKKLRLSNQNRDKLQKVMDQADYTSTVPEAVRVANLEKVSAT